MGNSQYRRQHYITYHGYKYRLRSVAGFIRQSGNYYLFPQPEISGGQGSERVNDNYDDDLCTKFKDSSVIHFGDIIKDPKRENKNNLG